MYPGELFLLEDFVSDEPLRGLQITDLTSPIREQITIQQQQE